MNGDGLTDILRIRNGEVAYWANMGYGRFSAKMSMEHAPTFDQPDQFNPTYIRLADIDGSGTTDIVYLGEKEFRVWMNLNGNSYMPKPKVIAPFPGNGQPGGRVRDRFPGNRHELHRLVFSFTRPCRCPYSVHRPYGWL